MNIKELSENVIDQIRTINKIFDSKEFSEGEKYRIVYKLWNENLKSIFDDLEIDCDFYDPDASYEEDTKVLVDMLNSSLSKFLFLREIFSL